MKEKRTEDLSLFAEYFFFPWLLGFLLVLIRKGEEEEKKKRKEKVRFSIFFFLIHLVCRNWMIPR